MRKDANKRRNSNISAGKRSSKALKNDEKIFRTVEKVVRGSGKNTERNFKRIARILETPERIAVRIAEKIPSLNNGKAFRAMFAVNREAETTVDKLVSQYYFLIFKSNSFSRKHLQYLQHFLKKL